MFALLLHAAAAVKPIFARIYGLFANATCCLVMTPPHELFGTGHAETCCVYSSGIIAGHQIACHFVDHHALRASDVSRLLCKTDTSVNAHLIWKPICFAKFGMV